MVIYCALCYTHELKQMLYLTHVYDYSCHSAQFILAVI